MKIFMALVSLLAFSQMASAQALEDGYYQGAYFSKKLQKTPTRRMSYDKSLYYRLNEDVILGGGTSLGAVRSMLDLGAKNVVLEARGTVHPLYPERVNFGPYGGGVSFGFPNLISAVHSANMIVVLKLRLVEPNGIESADHMIPDSSVFWDSYQRFAQRFAKIAQENAVEELVLFTGLIEQICTPTGRAAIPKLIDSVRHYYTGRIRLDVAKVTDLPALLNCVSAQVKDFDSFGFETGEDINASTLVNNFDDARKLVATTGADVIASGVSFTGLDQAAKFQRLFEDLRNIRRGRSEPTRPNLTIGLIDVDPDKISPLDESNGILGKTTMEVIKSWFSEL